MNQRKTAHILYGAAAFLGVIAAVFALLNSSYPPLLLTYRLVALVSAAGGVLLCVLGMSCTGKNITLAEQPAPPPVRGCPPPPAMPPHLSPEQLCEGSIGGARKALEQFAPSISQPVCAWQLERCEKALTAVLDGIVDGADPALAVDFAALYLPSAMQYIAACAAEGCPENAVDTLAHIACACEKQQDSLKTGERTIFEMEFRFVRTALEQAGFRWER